MAPTLILIRHAQALHNVNKEYDIPDPELSEFGHQQCKELNKALKTFPLAREIEAVIVSPMLRTMQTAVESLEGVVKEGVKWEVDPYWQENSDKPCDTGLPPVPALSLLHSTPPHIPSTHPLSLSLATLPSTYPLYPAKTGPFAFTRRAILARGHDALSALSTREEKVIAVVSHSGFLRTAVAGMWFRNGDFRVFEFEDGGVGLGEVRDWKAGRGLRESEETRERGGGLGGSRKEPAGIERMDFPEEGVGERAGDEPAVEVPGKGEGK